VDITITNVEDNLIADRVYIDGENVRKVGVKSLVDSGVYLLIVNEDIKI
jgi:hypothetical protein